MRSKNALAGIFLLALPPAAGGPVAARSTPKLVVLVVADQMRAEYLDRFASSFGSGGFARLDREGRRFQDARFAYAATSTGPGHSVIGSGLYPNLSGMVGNTWFSRSDSRAAYCAEGPLDPGDPRRCARPGADAGTGVKNPCWFEGTSLAQRVKERWPRARVVGASLKDRSAILLLGPGADAAYWFDEKERKRFVSSAAYSPDAGLLDRFAREVLPLFEKRLDPAGPRGPDLGAWQYSLARPQREVCPHDLPSAHTPRLGLGASFPHPLGSMTALVYSPLGNEMLARFVEEAVTAHRLGRNPSGEPDLLAVSFSSTDHVGHLYGPDSCEVADAVARLDRVLERLLRFLEGVVPRRDLVVFLTSDHGVAPVPEVARSRGISAGRIFLYDDGARTVGDLSPERKRLETELAPVRGIAVSDSTPIERAVVRTFQEPSLYLNREIVPHEELPSWRERVRESVRKIEGVREVYTSDEIAAGKAPEAVRLAFREDRSGDLLVVAAENWEFDSWKTPLAASHGQPYENDARVPLLVWGGAVRPGKISDRVDVASIAPTIASLLDLSRAGFSRPDPLPLGPAPGVEEEHDGNGNK